MKKFIRSISLLAAAVLLAVTLSFAVAADGDKVTLTYDCDGGSGSVDKQTCAKGSYLTLAWPDDVTAPEGKAFGGWKNGSTTYQPGAVYYPSGDTSFTAVWVSPVYIYVNQDSGSSSNDGSSEDSPVDTLNTAVNKIKARNGGSGSVYSNFIVLCAPYTTGTNGQVISVPATVTQISAEGEDITETAFLTVGGTILCKAPVWFSNLSMTDNGTHNLGACGNPLRFSDITTADGSYTVSNLMGAGSSTNYVYKVSDSGTANPVDTSLFIESGSFNYVYGGGLTVAAANTNIRVTAGSINYMYGGGQKKNVTGNVTVTLEGGSVKNLYAGGKEAGVDGKAEIYINGGSVSSVSEGCGNASYKVAGGATVGCSGEYVPVSYLPGTGVGTVTAYLQYRFGDTMRLEYPENMARGELGFRCWVIDGKEYYPGDIYQTGNTYVTATADWRYPLNVYVDQQNGSDSNDGTEAKPVKTLKKASELLRPRSNAGSVYLNIINIEGTYTASEGESFGTKDCCITGGTLSFTSMTAEADLRICCTTEGSCNITVNSGSIRIEYPYAKIGTLTSDGSVSIARGEVSEIRGKAAVSLLGGTVKNIAAASEVRIYGGKAVSVASQLLVIHGGEVGSTNCTKTELFLRKGQTLTVSGELNADTMTGGGKLSFTEGGKLTVAELTGGSTEIAEIPYVSSKELIYVKEGAEKSSFTGENIRKVSDGRISTGTVVTYFLEGKAYTQFAAEDGSFDLPASLGDSGYEFYGWFTDEKCTVPYTYAKTEQELTLWGKGQANEKAVFSLNTTGGTVEWNGVQYSSGNYSDFTNSKLGVGTLISLKAVSASYAPFLYWLDETTNTILSTEKEYSFRLGGDTAVSAVFSYRNTGLVNVTFADPNGKIISSQYIKKTTVLEESAVPVCSTAIPGKKFSCWDFDTTQKITGDTLITAVYASCGTEASETLTNSSIAENSTEITRFICSDESVTFVSSRKLGDEYELIAAGIKLTNSDGSCSYTSYADISDKNADYYLTKGNAGGSEWTAVPFMTYRDDSGKVYTYSGSSVRASSAGSAADAADISAVASYLKLDGGLLISTSMREFYESVVDDSDEYYTYDEMVEDINTLKEKHPDIVNVKSIGQSVLGRELWVVEIGNTDAEYRMFIKGSDHAREYINTLIVMKTLEFYIENWQNSYNGEKVCDIMQTLCICFEPMANPDGVMLSQQGLASIEDETLREYYTELLTPIMKNAQAQMVAGVDYDDNLDISTLCDENGIWWGRWAANINGVDLHRDFYEENLEMYNSAFKTYVTKHRTPDIKDAFGKTGLSQPESKACADYIDSFRFNMSITYHSYSPCLQLPWALAEEEQLANNYKLIDLLSDITSYNLNSAQTTGGKNYVNAGFNNWFICKYPKSACFTIETGYKSVDGHSDNTPLRMAQLQRLYSQNKYGPLAMAVYARDNETVGKLAAQN